MMIRRMNDNEDVMNKMLTPQQRQAVVMEQLKEVETKEAKAAELVSAATKAKSQAIKTYTTEAEKSALKNSIITGVNHTGFAPVFIFTKFSIIDIEP